MNQSRQKAYLTGMNGGYKTDKIKGMNELADTNGFNGTSETGYVGTYNVAYKGGMMGNVLLGQPDYRNQDNFLHNNVGEKVLLEQTFEYKLFIDATFKDYSKKPDPFKFVVKFNGTEPKTENTTISLNDIHYSYPNYLEGDTDVVMDRVFKNIRSVTINSLIMPKNIAYKTEYDGSYTPDGPRLSTSKYKYLILKIQELENNRCFSNNKAYGKESFIMKMDDDLCHHNNIWIPISGSRIIYPDSNLMTLNRLTVEICDDRGSRLMPTLDGIAHDFFKEYRELIDVMREDSYELSQTDVTKLISLKDIVEHIAPELCLTLNIAGAQLNTNTQYRH